MNIKVCLIVFIKTRDLQLEKITMFSEFASRKQAFYPQILTTTFPAISSERVKYPTVNFSEANYVREKISN